jgi:penicillin-binding protein 2
MIEPPDHIPDLRRLNGLRLGIGLFLSLIVARLWFLQIDKGPELAMLSETQRTRLIRRMAARGAIVDSLGRVLATSRSVFVVSVVPDEMKKNRDVLPRLAEIAHTTVEALAEKISTEIKKNGLVPSDPVPVVKDATIKLLTEIEEHKLDLPGVLVTNDPLRYYTDNQLCTHVLGIARTISKEELDKRRAEGYQGGDSFGKEGLEKTYETDLRGKDGGQIISVNARGRIQRKLDEIPPVPGHTLRLTLDRDLQRIAYEALKEELDHAGHPGSAVALDPRDGAVLALVSVPSYDLNSYGTTIARLVSDTRLRPLVNRASGSAYPCGSTFKLVTAAAGLETGVLTPNSRDRCPGFLKLGNRTFHCDKRSGHGWIDFEHAIGESCDVYFWRVGERVGKENLAAWARRFGLGEKTGIDLPSGVDGKGRIPTPEWKKKNRRGPWYPGDLLNMAIGQGDIGVTPLQLADYTAAIANGGTLYRPQLVREVQDISNGRPTILRRMKPEVRGRLGLRPENRLAIIAGMRRAFEPGGTAYGLGIPDIDIAGKTGTAQVTHKEDHSVFVCFAPVEDPRIAIAVLVERGGHGSDVAAPIAMRMLNQFFHRHLADAPIGRHSGVD